MRLPFWMLMLVTIARAIAAGSAAGDRTSSALELKNWAVEQMPGGTVTMNDGRLVIDDAEGCTVWWQQELFAPVRIRYDATMVSAGGPHDRVSDLNCFWMAQDPDTAAAPFAAHRRHGKFSEYDSLHTYYVGYGGNTNSTTRFRRYDAGNRPLLAEHDLRDRRFLLEPNHAYHIELVAADGRAEYYRDGEKIFSFTDPHPLTHGWFGFRTVQSHIVIENFRVDVGRVTDPAH
jgi:hypothetical protein